MELRLMMTAACNFKCSFCLNEYWNSTKKGRLLDAAQYATLVNAAQAAISTKKVTLTGGEPTLCGDLGGVIERLSELPIHLTMISNGFLLGQHLEHLGRLSELHVSFHSWDVVEWQAITRSKTTPQDVADAIRRTRSAHPDLRMKLNIVASPRNADRESIHKYVAFARENQLKLNVFRESTVRTAALGGDVRREVVSDWWDLAALGALVTEKTSSRTSYELDGASISLATTSTDGSRWESMWVSPDATAYVDILHRTQDLPLLPILAGDPDMLRLGLLNLASEASLHRMLDASPASVGGMLDEIVSHRSTLRQLVGAQAAPIALEFIPLQVRP